jgi:general secretion pathway protein C
VAFDALLKKYFPGVLLLLIALAAYFQASGATELVGAAFIAPAPSGSALLRGGSVAPVVPLERRTAQPIIERNPFDSVTGPLNAKPPPTLTPDPAKLETGDPLAAAACDGVNVFIVTESTDPLWSVAALQGSGEPRPRLRRVGDDVAGKKVEFIGFNPNENSPSVWLSNAGALCQALLFKTQAPLPAAPPPATPAADASAPPTPEPTPGRRGPATVPPEIASKIHKISDNEFQVDRGVVDKILEDQAELMRSARIVPETKDGKVVGVRMFGIRPDTLLGTLGLQNGDRLESINGFNMASPEKALEAYARLRTASNLNVKVSRRGQPMSIDYRIK